MTTLAIIPARGGSKGLPGKNLAMCAGKPLITWTISAALEAASVDEVHVTSDDVDIMDVATMAGAKAVKRHPQLATDRARMEDVVTNHLLFHGRSFDRFVLLQPTSPMRTATHIDGAMSVLDDPRYRVDAVFSVYEPSVPIAKAFRFQLGFLRGLVSPSAPFENRQESETFVLPNGAIYGASTDAYLQAGGFAKLLARAYEMTESESVDVDTEDDLQKAGELMRRRYG